MSGLGRFRTMRAVWLGTLLLHSASAQAALTDLGTVPMANASDAVVKPNVMFILDDSGSMGWEYIPDSVNGNNGKFCYRNSYYNGVYYNPAITYALPVDSTGANYPDSSFTAAPDDGFTAGSTTTNLATSFQAGNDNSGRAAYYYRYTGTSPATPVRGTCYPDSSYTKVTLTPPSATITVGGSGTTSVTSVKVNGVEILSAATSSSSRTSTVASRMATAINSCTRVLSGACGTIGYSASANGSTVTLTGPDTAAGYTAVVTDSGGMTYSVTAFTAGANAAESQNFANWYSYYRTRMLMMKSAAGLAFKQLDNKFRVGFITINPGNPVQSANYLAIGTFDPTQKANWYSTLYSQVPGASTPLRTALARVGRYYGGKHDGINSGMADDPVEYSCQQNFTILTTDGYWNETTSGSNQPQLNGTTAVGDLDNLTAGTYSSRASGTYQGPTATANTLSDVALYYYQTDLRPAGSTNLLGSDVSADNVPTSDRDFASHQHMTTFTLGLADGQLTYRSDYETATSGDFYNIKQGTANWPVPVSNTLTTLDDLWHAAVNGRGTYYNARDPQSLSDGLMGALNGIVARLGSGASSAVSSQKLAASNNYSYSTTYHTGNWIGDVTKKAIDPATGLETGAALWSAQGLLDAQVQAASDTRTIYTFNNAAANKLKAFNWANLTATEQGYFSNKCSSWTQCTVLNFSTADMNAANSGQNLLNYVRGQTGYEMRSGSTNPVFRSRDHVLGDIVNAKPVYVKVPTWSYTDPVTPSYSSFKSANQSRQAMVYAAANDGMVHAFNADTGAEAWAYLPKMVMPNLYLLAEQNYSVNHRYFVDGSPVVMDVFDTTNSAWKTILVGGLAGGGRGWYALDVTDPASPKALWELCSDSTLCADSDTDIGYSYGNPVITKRASDGRWVVALSSGYNNVSPGTGHGILYVLDALSGTVLSKVDTGSGTTGSPSGMSKISAWADSASTDNTAKWVYGGDMNGDVWRFDLTAAPASVMQIAALKDASGVGQPVTVQPELGLVSGNRVLFIGTGRYLGSGDLSDTQQQTIYAFKDTAANLGNLRLRSDMVVQTMSQTSTTTRSISGNPVDWSLKSGWYVDLNPGNTSPGERVNIDPLLVSGTLLVVSNVPVASACTTGGVGWSYYFNPSTGSVSSSLSASQSFGQKNSSSVIVGSSAVVLSDGSVAFVVKDAGGGGGQTKMSSTSAASGKRVSWRELTP